MQRTIKYIIFYFIMLLFAVITVGCHNTYEETEEFSKIEDVSEKTMEEEEAFDKETSEVIYVDVRGHVNAPGVYQLPEGSRVFEAIEKAGGMTKDASDLSLNQAEKLCDGQQIYIPSREEEKDSLKSDQEGIKGEESAEKKVNLNTATKEELMTLSGIGEAKAEAILRYREEQGPFQSIEDIKKIEGIKEGVFRKVKDQITV